MALEKVHSLGSSPMLGLWAENFGISLGGHRHPGQADRFGARAKIAQRGLASGWKWCRKGADIRGTRAPITSSWRWRDVHLGGQPTLEALKQHYLPAAS